MMETNIEDIYPLSPMQKGMLFHILYSQESGVYYEQSAWEIAGALDVAAFRQAWTLLIARHPVLRTSFLWEELDEPVQVVVDRVELPLEEVDWRDVPAAAHAERLAALQEQERERGFDLAQAPLMRLHLIRLDETHSIFLWGQSHLLADGWSFSILMGELFQAYEMIRQTGRAHLPPVQPFRDYFAWLQAQDAQQMESYWRTALQDFETPTCLPLGLAGQSGEGAVTQVRLSARLSADLTGLARSCGVTLSTVMQAALALTLARYSREEDICFGLTVSGRPPNLPGVDAMVGMFINTLPLRVRIPVGQPAAVWLKQLQVQVSEMRQYEFAPLVDVQRWSSIPHHQPLFETLFVFENYPVDAALKQSGGSLQVKEVAAFTRTNYPLVVAVSPGSDIGIELHYRTERLSETATQRFLGHLIHLLEGFVAQPEMPVERLPMLTEAEYQDLIVSRNQTAAPRPLLTATQIFEQQAADHPDATALDFEGREMTYAELNRQANQLAHYLQLHGVGPEGLVGLYFERSSDMYIAILAVQKAGGAYLPLDPAYPADRLAFMIADSGTPLILTHAHLMNSLPVHDCAVIAVDAEQEAIAALPGDNLPCPANSDHLAYVIYTSGSTGRPKGVLIEQRGLVNLSLNHSEAFHLEPGCRVLQFFSYNFDGSVADIFMTFLSGACLVTGSQDALMPGPNLTRLLREERVTHAILTTSALAALEDVDLPDLRCFMTGGEAAVHEVIARWFAGRQYFNVYGPTEISIVSNMYEVKDIERETENIPIGLPQPNYRVYILDRHQNPLPVGVPGELYIAGVGVARGYLNRPELTAERFPIDPFALQPGARMYKSGDLVRWREDGQIEFLGRVDFQIKIRGFRVELEEIERVMEHHPDISQAVVVVSGKQTSNPHLVSFVTMKHEDGNENQPGWVMSVDGVREYLKGKLPAYMIPDQIVVTPSLPLSPAGKVDRKVLEGLASEYEPARTAWQAPRTAVEAGLAELYEQVLKVERVGLSDDFFALGGHSLLATQLNSRIRQAFGVDLPLARQFENPQVGSLARIIEELLLQSTADPVDGRVEARHWDEKIPFSYSQSRLWFLSQLAPESSAYNIPIAIRLIGFLDVPRLETALSAILQRHAVLRSRFEQVDGIPVQLIMPDQPVQLVCDDLTALADEGRSAALESDHSRRERATV